MAITPFNSSRIRRGSGVGQVNSDGSISLTPADGTPVTFVGNGDDVATLDSVGVLTFKTPTGDGRKMIAIPPNPDVDTTNAPFNFNATTFETTVGKDLDFVFEMGHGNTPGTITSTWGGFRDAWESRYWTGSTYFAERHIAAVRTISGGIGEVRVFTSAYDQVADIAVTTMAGRQISFFNDDPDHDGNQEEFGQFIDNGSGTRTLQLATCHFAIQSGNITASAGNLTVVGSVTVSSHDVQVNSGVYKANLTSTVSSSADVDGPLGVALQLVVRDNTNGGTALVVYENGATPVIAGQPAGSATTFVTGAPSANQIQIKSRGAGSGIAYLAGSSRNGASVVAAAMVIG